MSRTYNIVCEDCGKYLWVGQGNDIYRGEEMDKFSEFLYDHEGHSIRFLECQDVPLEYKEEEDHE